MRKKIIFKTLSIFVISAVFLLSGCSESTGIDNTALAEAVSVSESGGKTVYTFYLLTSSDEQESVSIQANSLEQACALAKESYIPNLSLSKFELYIVNENLYDRVLLNDLNFTASCYSFSPIFYVTLADENTTALLSGLNDISKVAEEQIMLYKKNNPNAKVTALSIFNSFNSENVEEFSIPYISSDKELKTEGFYITAKK